MLLVMLPLLLLSLPTLLQAAGTFRRLRYHSPGYLWAVFLLALPAQMVAGAVATAVSVRGFVQQGTGCATGAGVFFVAGMLLAVVVTPGLALLAAGLRWRQLRAPEPLPPRVGL